LWVLDSFGGFICWAGFLGVDGGVIVIVVIVVTLTLQEGAGTAHASDSLCSMVAGEVVFAISLLSMCIIAVINIALMLWG